MAITPPLSMHASAACYYGAMTETHQGEVGRYIRYEVVDRVARVTVARA
ncbi:MAG: hypothetical protein Ct9H300mP26_3020 [Acidimicrobiales bacterium]|nr:MAG: hypothetical protein Ct9H300mP26_3020 [Acidimicrobiales bacterium]